MKCQNCGYESKNLEYCPICGEKIEEVVVEEEKSAQNEVKQTTNTYGTQYKVFAFIGYGLGILSLALCFVPFIFVNGIVGIIFSKIGDKPTNKQEFAKKGFIFSLIGTIVGFILTIIILIVLVALAEEYGYDFLDD